MKVFKWEVEGYAFPHWSVGTRTMRLDCGTIFYFKSMAEETDIPYQNLINLYLRDCAVHHRKLHTKWYPESA